LEQGVDALALETIERFFRLHYWQRSLEWDGGIGPDHRSIGLTDLLGRRSLAFRTAASHYRLIDQWAEPIVVPYGDSGKDLCDRLAAAQEVNRRLLRDSQRFTVNVPPSVLAPLVESGHAAVTPAGLAVLVLSSLYDDHLGLRPESMPDPADLMA
jgi:CRISPR-associated endonuclease/helicase Cas3